MSLSLNPIRSAGISITLISLLASSSLQAAGEIAEPSLCSNENALIVATTAHLEDGVDDNDNVNGTVLDAKTGLVWKKCSEGQSWDSTNNSCTGSVSSYSWPQALQQAQDVNAGGEGEALGQSDWRVPNIKELASITERRCYNPAINNTAFPNTPSSMYWSSSPYAGNANGAWGVGFYSGGGNADNKGNNLHVRLVRSGQ